MAERIAPDALLAQTNLTGAVTAIDDDPDSPDASWLTAPGSNTATAARVSFPSPSANLEGTQEFRVQVRKTNHSTNPTVVVELYENGALVATVVASTTVSSTSGQVVSGTFNASALANADGSLVECRVAGTPGGGSPGNRASVEVGAIEWNATVGASVVTGALTASGSGAASVASLVEQHASLTAIGSGDASVAPHVTQLAAISAAGSGTATVAGDVLAGIVEGAINAVGAGAATVSAAVTVLAGIIAAGSGSPIVSALNIVHGSALATGSGSGTVSAHVIVRAAIAAVGNGIASVSGDISGLVTGAISATGAGIASVSSLVTTFAAAIANGSGSASVSAIVHKLAAIVATGVGTATVSGTVAGADDAPRSVPVRAVYNYIITVPAKYGRKRFKAVYT